MQYGVSSKLRRINIGKLTLLFALFSPFSHAKPSETLETTGDILQWAIPVSAAFISVGKLDGEGLGQLVEGAILTSMSTHILKVAINAERPNGRDYSMPSGHTSAAAQGAAYLQFRYGWQYGIPAYMLTGVVGYSRVENNFHYWRDVAAGTALATAIQYSITRGGFSVTNLAVVPTISEDGFGVYASMNF